MKCSFTSFPEFFTSSVNESTNYEVNPFFLELPFNIIILLIKLVRNLQNSLTNITYIFDEPTSGLHPYDAEKIGNLLINLRNNHNNVFVVEHSKQMINLADYMIELGPGACINGGEIIYEGELNNIDDLNTPTINTLKETFKINENTLNWGESFKIENANLNNLKDVSVEIPKGALTAITGVAGSGKSSLCKVFEEKYPDSIMINQKPIGTSVRSNATTYIGIMDEIRKIFAKENKVSKSLFSFNSKGACPACKGTERIVYDMAFAESVEVICEDCNGNRYNKEALSYTYNGKNILEVMKLTVEEACDFFDNKKINNALKSLSDVGLEYLQLGQSTNTMSGGEIQRLKLADNLNKKGEVYILDEPSSGLHNKDLLKLLNLFKRLVNAENTVIIVEHRLEMIANADWIIDLGPNGGIDGGEVIFTGTPQEILKCNKSKTGKYLKNNLK